MFVKQEKIGKLLVDWGADVNWPDENGMPPIGWSIMRVCEEMVAFLVRVGADLNFSAMSELGETKTAEDLAKRKLAYLKGIFSSEPTEEERKVLLSAQHCVEALSPCLDRSV
jgi:hypothetical protein